MENVKEKLVEVIQKINPYEEFDDNTDLIEEELLDSLSIVNMVSQIEKELCVEIPLEKMKVDNFRSINTILSMLEDVSL